jgi:hypothetical protein
MDCIFGPELITIQLDKKLDSLHFETLLNGISPEKKEVISYCYWDEDQLRSLIAVLLIRKVLIQR